MVWAGISLTGKQGLSSLEAISMQRDIEMRFCNQWQSHISTVWDRTLLQEDNARPSRAGFMRDHLQNVGVERMEWPASSPDLNPIEKLWDQLGRAVRARVTNTTTLADLRQMLVEEWDAIPQQCVTRLVTSMRRRCQAVVAVYGSSTRY